jgi:hypothetical protein
VWNGRQWQLRKLTYRGTPPVIRFVFAVSETSGLIRGFTGPANELRKFLSILYSLA